jgi:hypothetical protein
MATATGPTAREIIEIRVVELRQLFNSIDPSPFHERDLDPSAEEFIVEWAKELPGDANPALVVHLERAASEADEARVLQESIHDFFARRSTASRRTLRELFRRGRMTLLIAVVFLTVAIGIVERLAGYLPESRLALVLREGTIIVGWVAMWRPVEIFLYDWWPIRAEARLFQRLSTMPVRIEYGA